MTSAPIENPTRDGPIEGRCKARRTNGEWCTKYPVKGAKVCATHGGRAPQVKAAAKRRRDEERAQVAVATYGLPREVAPDVALLEEVHRTAGHVAWLEKLIHGSDEYQLTQRGEQGVTVESAWMDMYRKERAHLVNVSKSALAAGIAERQVRVAEAQGAMLAGAVRQILDRLGLSAEQQALVPQVVPAVLREISGGG